MPETIKILLDTRESSETKDILELFLKSEEVMLPVGDILYNDTVVFEHKTINDFITSVFDGRLFTQIEITTRIPLFLYPER